MVSLVQTVRKTLDALISLLMHPIEQEDLQKSKQAAVSAVGLVALPGFGLLIRDGGGAGGERLIASVVIILVWMVFTGVLVRPERRKLELARNLGLVSIWIVLTQVLVMGAGILYDDPFGAGIRFLIVCFLLGVLVPTHLLRGTSLRTAVKLILPLWLTTGILAWRIIY